MFSIRRASPLRWRAAGGSSAPPSAMLPVQLRCRPTIARATGVLPGLTDQRQALVRCQVQTHRVEDLVPPVQGDHVREAQRGHLGLIGRRHLDRVADPALLPGDHDLGPDAADRVVRSDWQQRRHGSLAPVDAQGAAWREAAARGAAAGGHRMPGDADQGPAAGQAGDRADQAPGVGMARGPEKLVRAADLDHAPGVHDRDLPGQGRHHRQVVAHIEGGDVMQRREFADRRQHVRLRCDVQAGGRLVEDDQAGPVREGHREPDPLLLAAGQLVRVTLRKARSSGSATSRIISATRSETALPG